MPTDAELDLYAHLMTLKGQLLDAVHRLDKQCAILCPPPASKPYDIALRPDTHGADPFSIDTLMDDIVVNGVEMFRAEDMTGKNWWVACYMANGERICWSVTARSKPLRIEWVTTEWPEGPFVYEHERADVSDPLTDDEWRAYCDAVGIDSGIGGES